MWVEGQRSSHECNLQNYAFTTTNILVFYHTYALYELYRQVLEIVDGLGLNFWDKFLYDFNPFLLPSHLVLTIYVYISHIGRPQLFNVIVNRKPN